jgi:hypothetical protein
LETEAEQITTKFPHRHILNDNAQSDRLQFIAETFGTQAALNIEGESQTRQLSIPIGLAGPLKLSSEFNAYFPLATSEGALVASYTRGLRVLNKSESVEVNSNGEKLIAKAIISHKTLKTELHTTAESFYKYWLCSYTGITIAKSQANHGHFSNGITALLLALELPLESLKKNCLGNTIVQEIPEGISIQISLTNPLALPLDKLSEHTKSLLSLICPLDSDLEPCFMKALSLLTLAGEISIMAAMAASHFAAAHKKLRKAQ